MATPSVILQSNCFSVIEQTDHQMENWLQKSNNIIVTDEPIKKFTCYTIGYLERLLNEDKETSIFLQCDAEGMVQMTDQVVKIPTSFGEYHVLVADLTNALTLKSVHNWNFMSLEKTTKLTGPLMSLATARGGSRVSATHCQQGTDQSIYKIFIFHVDVPPRYVFEITEDEEVTHQQLEVDNTAATNFPHQVIFVSMDDEHLIRDVIGIYKKHLGTETGTMVNLYNYNPSKKDNCDGRFSPTKVRVEREIKALLSGSYYAVLVSRKDGTYQYEKLKYLIGQCRKDPELCHFHYTITP
jgi:hypothetical protein